MATRVKPRPKPALTPSVRASACASSMLIPSSPALTPKPSAKRKKNGGRNFVASVRWRSHDLLPTLPAANRARHRVLGKVAARDDAHLRSVQGCGDPWRARGNSKRDGGGMTKRAIERAKEKR